MTRKSFRGPTATVDYQSHAILNAHLFSDN
jgi:hypothetical protein